MAAARRNENEAVAAAVVSPCLFCFVVVTCVLVAGRSDYKLIPLFSGDLLFNILLNVVGGAALDVTTADTRR